MGAPNLHLGLRLRLRLRLRLLCAAATLLVAASIHREPLFIDLAFEREAEWVVFSPDGSLEDAISMATSFELHT